MTKCISPRYNRTGWLGVKYQVTYLLWFVSDVIMAKGKGDGAELTPVKPSLLWLALQVGLKVQIFCSY